ncbi:MAG: hypothetical protein GKR90_14320 [Pseudomonadales bacterium]|nr:hypothetical protein [Pseudomonadales bacterium]
MKYRTRIYYSESQKSLTWDRWQEGDLIAGTNNSYTATMVERQIRFVMLAHVKNKNTGPAEMRMNKWRYAQDSNLVGFWR